MENRITVELKDGVADVRLTRADKMNALDDAMFSALIETGERLKTLPGVRAIVLSGEGRAFCAGLDMGNFGKMASGERSGGKSSTGESLLTPNRAPGGSNRAQHAVMVWREQPVPVIAAIHGVAFGGGFQLALAADLRFVTADTRMAVMEIKWGLVPDMAGVVLMRGLVRDDHARELTYTGRIVSGTEAVALGLATRVCADPLAEARAMAQALAQRNPSALRADKRLMNASSQVLADSAAALLQAESDEQVQLMGKPNQVEAVRANLEKRAPVFSTAQA